MRVQVRRGLRSRVDDERGAITILMAVATIILIAVLAFITDFGLAYANKQALQSGVDAAALAAAQNIAETALPNQKCASIDAAMETSAASVVEEYFRLNGTADDAAVRPAPNGYIQCNGNALTVSVFATQTSPYILGTPFAAEGSDGIHLRTNAASAVGPAGSALGVRPFAVCKVDAAALMSAPQVARNIVLDTTTDRGCGQSSGNFGLMDLDGASNGMYPVAGWVLNGYEREITAGVQLEGKPGDTGGGALDDEMQTIVGDDVVLPVFDSVTAGGANARYAISGFISVEVCGFQFGSKKGIGGCFDYGAAPAPERNSYLQVRFKRFITVGQLHNTCNIGEPCDTGSRVVKLAR
jgi:Flp pilus assembly protein TadG